MVLWPLSAQARAEGGGGGAKDDDTSSDGSEDEAEEGDGWEEEEQEEDDDEAMLGVGNKRKVCVPPAHPWRSTAVLTFLVLR